MTMKLLIYYDSKNYITEKGVRDIHGEFFQISNYDVVVFDTQFDLNYS